MAETDSLSRAEAYLRSRRQRDTPPPPGGAGTPGTARRQRFPSRRPGSGRVTTPRAIELRGRRTGWQAKASVLRDADGLDNIDDFFGGPTKKADAEQEPEEAAPMELYMDDDMAPSPQSMTMDGELSPPMSGPRSVRKRTRSSLGAGADKENNVLSALPSPAATPVLRGKGGKRARKAASPLTPDSLPPSTPVLSASMLSTPGTLRTLTPSSVESLPAGDESFRMDDDDDEEEDSDPEPLGEATPAPTLGKGKGKRLGDEVRTPRVVLTYSDEENEDEAAAAAGPAVRRSRRQRTKPLEWWKGTTQVEYTRDREGVGIAAVLPVISKVKTHQTPVNEKLERARKAKKRSQASKRSMAKLRSGAHQVPMHDKHLPAGRTFEDGTVALVATEQGAAPARVLCREADQVMTALPVSAERPKNRTAATLACKTFTDQGSWVAGFLELPPRAMKDPETVGDCTQLFCVTRGQPGALEVAVAKPSEGGEDLEWQRYRVQPGDSFYLPPNNAYQLENHSPDAEVRLSYFIVEP